MAQVEREIDKPKADDDRVALLLDTLETQIGELRALYARRDAEAALEAERTRYAAATQEVDRLRAETKTAVAADE